MIINHYLLTLLIAIFGLQISYTTIFAAGSSDDRDSSMSEIVDINYSNGKDEAYNGNFRAAIVYLERAIKENPENADAFNLLGYSNRKLGKNDKAFKFYNKALDLDPRHKGAHEYIGRLYLNLKQPENAKKHLAKLVSICFFGCDEYTILKEAIEDYEKNKTYRNY
jgi:Flp pilus assembly protein TadD